MIELEAKFALDLVSVFELKRQLVKALKVTVSAFCDRLG